MKTSKCIILSLTSLPAMIFMLLLVVPFFFASCKDDEVISDADLSLVSLEDGKSLIFGNWYILEPGDIGSDNYYTSEISETGIRPENENLKVYTFVINEWTKVSNGIQAKGYRYSSPYSDKQYEDSIVFYKILNRKLYVRNYVITSVGDVYFTKDKDGR